MNFFRYNKYPWILVHLLVHCSGSLNSGFSRLQHGHRLDRCMINSFPEFSFLDCVTECLVTPRCVSVNYFKGANFCEINYKDKETAGNQFANAAGWVYSERIHWPKEFAGACLNSNCTMNETCKLKKYSEYRTFECALSDCGIPNGTGMDLSKTKREDAIGILRRIHASCSDGYFQFGSGRLICQSNGQWEYDIICLDKRVWTKYENHIYHLATDRKTWNDAKTYCESEDAYLVEIDYLDENTWVYQHIILPYNSLGFCSSYGCDVWIGGSDQKNEGHFVWSRNEIPIYVRAWSGINPDDWQNNEDCLQIRLYDGLWNDKRCDYVSLFVCEKDIN